MPVNFGRSPIDFLRNTGGSVGWEGFWCSRLSTAQPWVLTKSVGTGIGPDGTGMCWLIQSMSSPNSEKEKSLRLKELQAEIKRHDELYYRLARPEISDQTYDQKKQELDSLQSELDPPGLFLRNKVRISNWDTTGRR